MHQNCFGRANEVGRYFDQKRRSWEVIYQTNLRDWAAEEASVEAAAEQCTGAPRRGQRDTSGALANPQRRRVGRRPRRSATERAPRGCTISRRRWDRYVSSTRKARLDVCPRENQNWNEKGGDTRKGERWWVQTGQLLTAVFYYFILYISLLLVF